MSTQNYAGERAGHSTEDVTTSRFAKGALDSAQQAGAEAASTIMDQVKTLLNDKVVDGADTVGRLANSVHSAAEELDENAPQMAGLVRGVADRLDGYATDLRNQSVDDLVRAASDYTRRQPAVVFGLAAVVGFFALRTIKSAPPARAVGNRARDAQAGGFYGS